jgi:hypothetical protein
MRRRVRPTLAHTDSYHRRSLFAKVFSLESDAKTHRTPKVLRAKSLRAAVLFSLSARLMLAHLGYNNFRGPFTILIS